MLPLERITVEDVMALENTSRKTAYREMREIKDYFGITRPRFYHYMRYNSIEYIELMKMLKEKF